MRCWCARKLLVPAGTDDHAGNAHGRDTYNQLFTLHGTIMIFLFIIPGHAGHPGQFRAAVHAGRQGRGLPPAEPAEPLSLVDRGRFLPGDAGHRQPGHGLDVLHALQHDHADGRRAGLAGRVHSRVQLDLHRAELHRHDPHPAPAGDDLVPHAAVPLGLYATALIQVLATPVLGITLLLLAVERIAGIGIFDPEATAATRSSSSTSSGSIPIRPCTS